MKPWLIVVGVAVMLLALPLDLAFPAPANPVATLTTAQAVAFIYNFVALVVSGFLVLLGATWPRHPTVNSKTNPPSS